MTQTARSEYRQSADVGHLTPTSGKNQGFSPGSAAAGLPAAPGSARSVADTCASVAGANRLRKLKGPKAGTRLEYSLAERKGPGSLQFEKKECPEAVAIGIRV